MSLNQPILCKISFSKVQNDILILAASELSLKGDLVGRARKDFRTQFPAILVLHPSFLKYHIDKTEIQVIHYNPETED